MKTPFDIIVIASRHRPPIITQHLRGTPYQTWHGEDYPKPDIKVAPRAQVLGLPTGAGPYRCFRAHQDATKLAKADAMLMFEDDARPINGRWKRIAAEALPLLNRYEIVSLHGRDQANIIKSHPAAGTRFNVLGPIDKGGIQMVWQLGALAYLMRQETAAKLRALAWDGFPVDLVICNDFSFCVADYTPFRHDRQHGSLVETR